MNALKITVFAWESLSQLKIVLTSKIVMLSVAASGLDLASSYIQERIEDHVSKFIA